ncbi:MAG: DUF4331 family protein [Kofleriaceae bacterium]
MGSEPVFPLLTQKENGMRKLLGASVAGTLLAGVAVVAMTYQSGEASDHDDGENAFKNRALNLTDHFAFKSPAAPTELAMIMYFNPRSLPGRQYFMAQNARYEFHVTKIGARTEAATAKEDFVFRFEAVGAPAGDIQQVKLTVLKDQGGTLTEVGTHMGSTTAFGKSKAGGANITTNTQANVGGVDVKWFIGQRADSFTFDVVRFFQVRAFLAQRFFGGTGGVGDATASLGPNCRGDAFLSILGANPSAGEAGGVSDGDQINLFNPPSCAPDFTKNLNVTAIVLNVPIAQLGGTIFDTWSTISVAQ